MNRLNDQVLVRTYEQRVEEVRLTRARGDRLARRRRALPALASALAACGAEGLEGAPRSPGRSSARTPRSATGSGRPSSSPAPPSGRSASAPRSSAPGSPASRPPGRSRGRRHRLPRLRAGGRAGRERRSPARTPSRVTRGARTTSPSPSTRNPALETLLDGDRRAHRARRGRRPGLRRGDALPASPRSGSSCGYEWHAGLYPRAGASPRRPRAALPVRARDARASPRCRDAKGRRAFAVPTRRSSDDAELHRPRPDLDARVARANGFTSQRLRWFVEYACRDDFGGEPRRDLGVGRHPLLRLAPARATDAGRGAGAVPDLARGERPARRTTSRSPPRGRIVTGALVFDVVPRRREARPSSSGTSTPRRTRSSPSRRAHAVCALPKFAAAHVLAPWREAPPGVPPAFEYAPWLVANVTLSGAAEGAGRSRSRGTTSSTTRRRSATSSRRTRRARSGRDHGPTVLTYYHAFAGEEAKAAREKLFGDDVGGARAGRPRRPLPRPPRPPRPRDADRRLPLGARDAAPAPASSRAPSGGSPTSRSAASASPTPTAAGCRSSRRRRTRASGPPSAILAERRVRTGASYFSANVLVRIVRLTVAAAASGASAA